MAATESVGIDVRVLGVEEAKRELEQLEHELKSLSGFKTRIELTNRLKELRREAEATRSGIAKLKKDQLDLEKGTDAWTKNAESLRKMRTELSAINADISRTKAALNSVKPLGQVFNRISSSVAHMGSAMQSAGNAIQRLMTPLRMMGTGALLGAGYKAMNTVSEGLSKGFARYDIMKKYPKMMAQFETANYSAQKSIDELNDAVLGLPTGLDEIVDLSQQFTMTIGDMEKGTKLAIATNNAFLASMSSDTQRYQGMMQLRDVLGGKNMNAREWQSLAQSMMPAIRMMGEDMGKSGKELNEWVSAVQQGKVSNEEFLKALEKTGTGMGKAAQMAELSKDTWEGFTANVSNAFARMSQGVIESLDEITKIATGGKYDQLNKFLAANVRPAIDGMAESVKGWIKAHPQEIIGFFNDLKSVDWVGLGRGVVQGIGEIVGMVQKAAKWLSGRNLEGIGKGIVRLNMIGQGLLIFGGMLKGARHLIAGAGTVLVGLGRILGGLGAVGAGEKILGFVNFFKNFGKVGAAATAASGAAGAGGAVALGATFKAFIPAIEGLAGVGAILTMASGIAALDTKLLSMAVDNMVKITDGMGKVFRNVKGLKGQDFDAGAMKNAVEQMFQIWEVFSGSGETVDAHGAKRGGGRSIAQMDKKLLSDMAESMVSMSSIIGSMTQMDVNLKALKGFKGFDAKITEGISNFATALGGIYTAFDSAFGGEGAFGKGAINPEQAKGFATIMESSVTVFSSLNKVTKQIPKLMGGLGNIMSAPNGGMGQSPFATVRNFLVGEDGKSGMFYTLHELFQKMDDDFDFDVSGFADKLSSAVEAFKSIRKIGNQLSKMGEGGTLAGGNIDTAIANIKSFITKLSTALDTTVVGDIQMKVGALKTTIDSIFSALNADLSNVKVTVNINGDVKGDDELVNEINKAHTRITNAVRKIPSTITKTVTVNINGNVNNNTPSIPSILHHRGGIIRPLYRASGGSIFKPKGSDTVPAMLTPGEWVMRRSAVNAFGQRFMDRINNMDIRGAMKELSARAGHIASVNRGVTNYITNNNNQSVTQNINTNNPNFAYKRSNRYVMAL